MSLDIKIKPKEKVFASTRSAIKALRVNEVRSKWSVNRVNRATSCLWSLNEMRPPSKKKRPQARRTCLILMINTYRLRVGSREVSQEILKESRTSCKSIVRKRLDDNCSLLTNALFFDKVPFGRRLMWDRLHEIDLY